jgi:hypothetical protein
VAVATSGAILKVILGIVWPVIIAIEQSYSYTESVQI